MHPHIVAARSLNPPMQMMRLRIQNITKDNERLHGTEHFSDLPNYSEKIFEVTVSNCNELPTCRHKHPQDGVEPGYFVLCAHGGCFSPL
jgi:hypothetical protein